MAANDQDLRQIWDWNSELPGPVDNQCVHEIIAETMLRQPEAIAVSAWDGELTYRELDVLSCKVAYELHSRGVRPGADAPVIVLCFEKSKWTSVAMLGIMKAGGISAALDVSQPTERLSSIVEQTRSNWILCTAATKDIAESICGSIGTAVEVGGDPIPVCNGGGLPKVHPQQTVFVTYTSGSTGKPKGACVSHANVAAAIHYQGRLLGFPGSKVLDLAPYSFDVAWSNMLHTLCAGGRLCIPKSNDMLKSLAACIERYGVTLVNITPTMLRTLDRKPASLRDILLSGEPPGPDLLARWAGQVNLKNTYGPAECTFKSAFAAIDSNSDTRLASNIIGKGTGAVTWIVDPEERNHLVAIGEVGELWLEGPLVGQGYLNDPEKTAAAFVRDPSWSPRGRVGRRSRLYRTGDLVRYDKDGSLVFVGRKDRQVKIKGCRVELGDVEHHLRRSLACHASEEIVVEALTPLQSDTATLVAFLTTSETSNLPKQLNKALPTYMIPSAFIYIPGQLPRTGTGKTDRKRLREIGTSLTLGQLAMLNRSRPAYRSLCTPMEVSLRQCWAEALGIRAESIGVDDSFFHLGGDSIRAINLVGIARERGLAFEVVDIFQHPKLCDLAGVASEQSPSLVPDVQPFSLLKDIDGARAIGKAALACVTSVSNIEDMFPLTPFQAGLFALSMRCPGDYVSVRRYELPQSIDLDRFRSAWERVAVAAPILRTRIANLEDGQLVQIVLRSQIQWSESTEDEIARGGRTTLGPGTPRAQFALVRDGLGGRRSFVWTMHHALFDGFSRATILTMLEKAYAGGVVEPAPQFQRFIKHIASIDVNEASSAWKGYFRGNTAPTFPTLPSLDYKPRSEAAVTHTIEDLQWAGGDITPATVVVTAWTIVMAEYTSSSDVVFGTIGTGREAPVAGIERMTGPTAAVVPFRLKLHHDSSETTQELLCRTQEQRLSMQRFEQMGLSQIRRISAEAEQACGFQTLLVVHPTDDVEVSLLSEESPTDKPTAGPSDGASTYALMLACRPQPDGLQVIINFDPLTIDHASVERMQLQYETVLRQLCLATDRGKSAACVKVVSDSDLERIKSWNASVPKPMPSLVHELLTKTAQQQPDAPAVHAWDGSLTYGQLDELSTRLARGLVVGYELQPNNVVPICSEKSVWTSVAILAVMKAGAASITFDITQPEQRLRNIVEQIKPRVILASPASCAIAARVASDIKTVSIETLLQEPSMPPDKPQPEQAPVTPSDTLFLVFTSGSTGSPKGICITHENFASALTHQTKRLGFNRQSRVFDFASYAFDAAYYNLLHTLYAGGCLCVPSEDERLHDLSGSICRLGATFANLTPKLVEVLDAGALRQLELVELSGETPDAEVVARLRKHTSVRFAYGPAECSVMSSVSTADAPVSNIGRGIGVCCWIVSCRDAELLAPVGCVGELWIEGPLVSNGYLGDNDKTAAAFIDDPAWLRETVGRNGKVYRTGDLVQYARDGSLKFVGRNDSQVKIRGQRVELTDVACHVQQCLASVDRHSIAVLAEVVQPSQALVAFVTPPNATSMTAQKMAEMVALLTCNIQQRLSMVVSPYMIPSRFIPIEKVPLTATGKIDRQYLRSLAQQSKTDTSCMTQASVPCQQLTETEVQLRSIWARVLKIAEHGINGSTPFWGVGDSITAMSLIVAIRRQFGVELKLSTLAGHKTTLGSLSMTIEEARLGKHAVREAQTHADLEEMIRQLGISACADNFVASSSCSERSVAFLTGSTGFLGTRILRELLASGRFRKVVVLVRSYDEVSGLARVKRAAKAAGWWSDDAAQLIEVWHGDLSKPLFNLSTSQLGRLAGTKRCQETIDTIIHNGAAVHWTADYESIRPANVDSTFQLLAMGVRSQHLRRFVYVSGGRCPNGKEQLAPEDEVSAYVKSKFMSERMVLAMADHTRQPRGKFAVVKPALIIGDAETGAGNVDDFLWRYVQTCIKLRAFPREDPGAWLPVAEVSTVAHEILRQATAHKAEPFSCVTNGMPLRSFWEVIQATAGVRFAELSSMSWLDMVRTDIENEGETHALWPVQDFLGTLGVAATAGSDTDRSRTALKTIARLQMAVAQNLRYLHEEDPIVRRGISSRGGRLLWRATRSAGILSKKSSAP